MSSSRQAALLPSATISRGAISSICRSRYGRARLRFERFGGAVVRRTAFQHVRDVDVLSALEAERDQHAVQQLAGGADERLALRIFVGAGRLADEHPLRVCVAYAGDGRPPRPAQPAGRARCDVRDAARRNRAMRFARAAPPRPAASSDVSAAAGRRRRRAFAGAGPNAAGRRNRHTGERPSSRSTSSRRIMARQGRPAACRARSA